jgi:DNA polymerase
MGVKQVEGVSTRQWTRLHTRGPILVENIVQAFCRDLLAEAMLRVESHGYRVVLHVHDEAASECVGGQGSLEAYGHILKQMPPWAESMPLEVDGWEGRRYRKK